MRIALGRRWTILVALLVLAVAVTFAIGAILVNSPVPGLGFAALVLRSNDGQGVNVTVPFPVGGSATTLVEIVDNMTERWYATFRGRFPIGPGTVSSASLFNQDGTRLRLATNGTLIVGIEWQRRSAEDSYPFGMGTLRPALLEVEVLPAGSNVSLAAILFTTDSVVFDRDVVTYAITLGTGPGPSGVFEGVHPGYLLRDRCDVLPLGPSGAARLVWGTFTFNYR